MRSDQPSEIEIDLTSYSWLVSDTATHERTNCMIPRTAPKGDVEAGVDRESIRAGGRQAKTNSDASK